jgi:protein-tyrosine phosphatase
MIGHPMHPDAACVLEQLGGDPSGFSGRQLSPKIASHADLILTMTRSHRDVVLEHAPHGLSRTFTIGEAANLAKDFGTKTAADLAHLRPQLRQREITDVRDPIGHGAQVFSEIGSQIAELLDPVLLLLRRASEDENPAGQHVE